MRLTDPSPLLSPRVADHSSTDQGCILPSPLLSIFARDMAALWVGESLWIAASLGSVFTGEGKTSLGGLPSVDRGTCGLGERPLSPWRRLLVAIAPLIMRVKFTPGINGRQSTGDSRGSAHRRSCEVPSVQLCPDTLAQYVHQGYRSPAKWRREANRKGATVGTSAAPNYGYAFANLPDDREN